MDDQLPTPQQLPPQHASTGAAMTTQPLSAADSDNLELAWSQRAHGVLSAAAHDPRQLASSFAELKAQYIQTRYGKQIPVKKEEA